MKYDYLVVGSGLYGAVFAREAADRGKKVLVIDKRPNVAGNIYTEKVEGIHVHKYGAHIFHTNDTKVWKYITRFAEFNRFTNSPVANYRGELYSLPFNMYTFNKMWGVVTPTEAAAKIEEQKKEACITEPKNLEEQAISLVGRDIFEKLIKGYTEKQWGRDCKELPAFIIKRLPVRLTFDNNYFNALYQGIPIGGYTQLTMRTFHTGGVASEKDITQGLPRVEELFEARKPKREAMLAEISGTISLGENKKKREMIITSDDGTMKAYPIAYGSRLKVKEGDRVVAGDELTEGQINPHDLLRILGVKAVQEHLLKEVLMVYRLQGVGIGEQFIDRQGFAAGVGGAVAGRYGDRGQQEDEDVFHFHGIGFRPGRSGVRRPSARARVYDTKIAICSRMHKPETQFSGAVAEHLCPGRRLSVRGVGTVGLSRRIRFGTGAMKNPQSEKDRGFALQGVQITSRIPCRWRGNPRL